MGFTLSWNGRASLARHQVVVNHSIGPENFAQATKHVAERLCEAVASDTAAAGLGAVGGRAAPLVLLLVLLVHHIRLLRRVTYGFFWECDAEFGLEAVAVETFFWHQKLPQVLLFVLSVSKFH